MRKSKLKKVGLTIIPLVIIIIAFIFIDSMLPEPLTDSLDFWGIVPKDNLEYISDDLFINDKHFFVYSTFNSNNNDVYTISVGDITGKKFNKYNIISYREIDNSQLALSEYSKEMNVSNFPELEVKNGSEYIGGIYTGTVPSTCESVLVNGIPAEMIKQTFQLNGKSVQFYLYYCVIEDDYTVNLTIIDRNGTRYSVTPVEIDGLMYPNIQPIE